MAGHWPVIWRTDQHIYGFRCGLCVDSDSDLGAASRSHTADEVPTGFYNLFEMVIEGAYNFAENIAGAKVRDFFPYFMSILLIILVTNWTALIPGWDSIGIWEYKPHFLAEKATKALEERPNRLAYIWRARD